MRIFTRNGEHVSVGKIVWVLGELNVVLLDQEAVVVLCELPDEVAHVFMCTVCLILNTSFLYL